MLLREVLAFSTECFKRHIKLGSMALQSFAVNDGDFCFIHDDAFLIDELMQRTGKCLGL